MLHSPNEIFVGSFLTDEGGASAIKCRWDRFIFHASIICVSVKIHNGKYIIQIFQNKRCCCCCSLFAQVIAAAHITKFKYKCEECIGLLFGISFSSIQSPMLTNRMLVFVFNQMISGVFKCNTRFNDGCFFISCELWQTCANSNNKFVRKRFIVRFFWENMNKSVGVKFYIIVIVWVCNYWFFLV